jgi:hypothetical protein
MCPCCCTYLLSKNGYWLMSWLFKLHLSSNEYFVNKIKMIKKKKRNSALVGTLPLD